MDRLMELWVKFVKKYGKKAIAVCVGVIAFYLLLDLKLYADDIDYYTAYAEKVDGYYSDVTKVVPKDSGAYTVTIDGTDYDVSGEDYDAYMKDNESVHATVHDLTVAKVENSVEHPKQELDAKVCTASIVTMPWQDYDPVVYVDSIVDSTGNTKVSSTASSFKWESAHINLNDYTRLEKNND